MTKHKSKRNLTPYYMILPTFIGLLIFSFYPIFLSITKSFFTWSGSLSSEFGINKFIWFDNYINIFKDDIFWKSWGNVLFFIVTAVIINLTMPFICAELINSIKSQREKFIYRVLLVIPMIVPGIVNFLLWEFIYLPNGGLISQMAGRITNILGDSQSVKWGIRFIGVPWVGGLAFLIYLARISNIEGSMREAAAIDGANVFQQIIKIDIPLAISQFKMVFILTVIGEIQDFVKIQTITGGGPNFSSIVPGLFMYNEAFGKAAGYGKACAVGVTMLIVMISISYSSNKLFKTEEY